MPKHAVIIGPSNIGDAILAAEVIAQVHTAAPDVQMTLVVGARARSLFEEDPRIHTLLDADAFEGWRGRLRLALVLWREHPEIVVDLRHTALPVLLTPCTAWRYLSKPPRHITHMRDRHLWTLARHAPQFFQKTTPSIAPSARPQGLARDFAPPSPKAGLQDALWFSEKDRAHVQRLWSRWNLEGHQPVAIVCPGARSHIKRWTAEGFAQVADRLITACGARVIFSGEPAEEPVVEEILSFMTHRAHNAISLTTARQAGLLMQRAHIVITNDSASLHLASLMNVPTVAIFGPTDDTKYGPTATRHQVIRRQLFCSPCEQAQCRFHLECMRFVTPHDVYEAAQQLLQ